MGKRKRKQHNQPPAIPTRTPVTTKLISDSFVTHAPSGYTYAPGGLIATTGTFTLPTPLPPPRPRRIEVKPNNDDDGTIVIIDTPADYSWGIPQHTYLDDEQALDLARQLLNQVATNRKNTP